MYLNHIDTSHVVIYHGKEGLRLKTPFRNFHTKRFSTNKFTVLGLKMENSVDLNALTEKQRSPVWKYSVKHSTALLKFA